MPHQCLTQLWIERADLLTEELHARWSIGRQDGWARGLDDQDAFDVLCELSDALREALDQPDYPKVAFDHSGLYATGPIEELSVQVGDELATRVNEPAHAPPGPGWLTRVNGAPPPSPTPEEDAAGRLFKRVREALDAGRANRALTEPTTSSGA